MQFILAKATFCRHFKRQNVFFLKSFCVIHISFNPIYNKERNH